MPMPRAVEQLAATFTLSRSFEVIRGRMGASLAASIAILYAFGSMYLGAMLQIGFTDSRGTTVLFYPTPVTPAWWSFPAIVVVAPGGILILPFLATVSMLLVSLGVGVGMSVGMILTYRVLRDRRKNLGGASAATTLAGLTPAMIALVTLGACCSSLAAATAGIGVVAATTGTSIDDLLANSWYLNVFQMVVLGVALLAQEQLLSVFSGLLPPTGEAIEAPASERLLGEARTKRVGVVAFRLALLVGGVTWSLSTFAEWTLVSPVTASAGTWTFWLLEQQLLAVFAIVLSFSWLEDPVSHARWLERPFGMGVRGVLLVAGLLTLAWVPPVIARTGLHGLVNELLWGAGAPAAWGAVPPAGFSGAALVLRWGLQFALLGTLAVVFAIRPLWVLELLGRTSQPPLAPEVPSTPAGSDPSPISLVPEPDALDPRASSAADGPAAGPAGGGESAGGSPIPPRSDSAPIPQLPPA